MENQAEILESEYEEEEQEEAPSLADLPLAYDQSSPEYPQLHEKVRPWKQVLKACRAPKTSENHDFEFSSADSTPKWQKKGISEEFCPADKLFYKGQLLPLNSPSDYSPTVRQDSQSSSTSQSSNGSSNGPARASLMTISGNISRASSQKRSSWQYVARGLLSSPDTSWSSTTTLRSQYGSSPSGRSRVRSPQEDCTNPRAVEGFASVKRREENRKGWWVLTPIVWVGNGCKDSSGVVAEAHRSMPKGSSSRIGRYNAIKEKP